MLYLYADINPPTKCCTVPSGDLTAVVQLPGGAAQYFVGYLNSLRQFVQAGRYYEKI